MQQPERLLNDTLRNRVAIKLANLMLRIADKNTQAFIAGAIRYGMNAAANDHKQGNEPPPNWETWAGRD